MHEMGIAMQIIEIATASIPENMRGKRVERINLEIGKLSTVVPDSLRFCFEIAAKETPLCDAELSIHEIPVTIVCNGCRARWTAESPVFICPRCESGSLDVVSGRELDIRSIEIED